MDLTAVLRSAGAASGPLALAAVGLYGGTYAALFKPPFDGAASFLCLVAIASGVTMAVIRLAVVTYRDLLRTADAE